MAPLSRTISPLPIQLAGAAISPVPLAPRSHERDERRKWMPGGGGAERASRGGRRPLQVYAPREHYYNAESAVPSSGSTPPIISHPPSGSMRAFEERGVLGKHAAGLNYAMPG